MNRRRIPIGFVTFFALMFLLPVILHPLSGGSYYLGVMAIAGINSMVVIGLNLLIGYAGQISLGHAAFFGLGAYSSAIITGWELPPLLGITCSLGLGGGVGYLVARPILRLRGHYLAMATLGLGLIMHVLFSELAITGGAEGIAVGKLSLGGLVLSQGRNKELHYFYLIWILIGVMTLFSLNLVNSRIGRALKAIRDSEIGAEVSGVDTAKYKAYIFALSAAFASLAGSVFAHYITYISPSDFDLRYSIKVVTMAVIGGMSEIWGGIFGAFLLTVLPEFLTFLKEYDIIFYGLTLMVIMIAAPHGVFRPLSDIASKLLKRAKGKGTKLGTQGFS